MKHLIIVIALLLTATAALTFGLRSPSPEFEGRSVSACRIDPLLARLAPSAGMGDLRSMVAGLVITGFPGDHPTHEGFAEFLDFVHGYPVAGVIHLRRNVRRRDDVAALNTMISRVLERPFIMVDEEGGVVTRLGGLSDFPSLPAAQYVARVKSPAEAQRLYGELAEALAKLGFNVNLGPVVDLARNSRNPVIAGHGRAYSAMPAVVLDYARAFSHAHAEAGILTALKHFPGHGSSDADTHFSPADVTSSWHADELVPFAQLIEEGLAPMVMTSHVTLASEIFSQTNAEVVTFSRNIVGYLRDRLCHDGLVVTDDMTMSAVSAGHSLADGMEQAIRAGHDLVIIAAPRWIGTRRLARAIDALAARAASDPELAAIIDRAHRRVAAFKRDRFPAHVAGMAAPLDGGAAARR